MFGHLCNNHSSSVKPSAGVHQSSVQGSCFSCSISLLHSHMRMNKNHCHKILHQPSQNSHILKLRKIVFKYRRNSALCQHYEYQHIERKHRFLTHKNPTKCGIKAAFQCLCYIVFAPLKTCYSRIK